LGIIQKQAFSNSIYSYLGAGIGFVTVAIIFAHLLTTEQNGLLSILVSVSGLTGALTNMGVNGITRIKCTMDIYFTR
jgi:O-antigen/teichoic acid export membrane protein